MASDKDSEAAKMARALLQSVGLQPGASLARTSGPRKPIRRRSTLSVDAAFGKLPRVNRAESFKRMSKMLGAQNAI